MAMPHFMRISSASISARGITGIFNARARTISDSILHGGGDHTTSTSAVTASADGHN